MWSKFKFRIRMLKPAQLIVLYYFIAISLSFILLRLPGVHQNEEYIPVIDSLFTAVSAVSVTGLTVISISEVYTTFGIVMIMLILQLGGIGIMSLGTFVWLLVGKKIGLRERQLIMIDHNQYNLSGVVKLIIDIIKILLLIEAVGALLLAVYFTQFYETFSEALLHGVFASVSATTNGGFDITGQSMLPYADDYFVQSITILLIILGAIGFPVLIELKQFLSNKDGAFRFSLFTKLTTITFGILLAVGTLMIFLMEFNNRFEGVSWHKALFYSLFQSTSTRSGGLVTLDVSSFTEPTQLVLSLLMFIGASPSSVGGGIRTTTLAIAVLFLIHFSKGNNQIQVFGREIHLIDVFRSYVVIILAALMSMASIITIMMLDSHDLMAVVFEVTSAFGTSGMSMGITPELSTPSKFIIMMLMFIGRVGLISFLFMIGGNNKKAKYHYPKERVIIG
ncbi:TrkH family potassium uptake protein [Jeotgalibacillus proteolyticus]|uniref:Ktr system potassium uptake protein D n=1 Tax=Jeotgalibacillus proteolyticus TaxID=2082395 RepID=A0A2S5GH12_9BACL|nr:TrkH family potassium uptake protein [Jeotgalibacillus proteolyticus]PPA72248.1 Ktr system potassium uptake protein D [Jeotgalibacillus proteolyticus]